MSGRFKFCILFVLSVVFCWGFLGDMTLIGPGDWDQHLFYHGAPARIIASFKQFPLWNPYYCGGAPLLANPQSPFLSPFILLPVLFGAVTGLKLSIILHLFLGLVGMQLLSERLNIKGFASVLPGVIFFFSGVFVLHLTEGHSTWLPMAYIPWVFLFYLRSVEISFRNLAVTSAFIALMLFEGAVLLTLYTVLFLAVYSLINSIEKRSARSLACFVLTLGLFFLFSAVKLLPMLELMSEFPRVVSDATSMDLEILYSALLGFDQSHSLVVKGMNYGWWEYSAYVGPIALLLYLASFFKKGHLALKLSGLVFLLISLGSFHYLSPWEMLTKFPVFSEQRVSPRYIVFFIFSVAILAGTALSRISERYAEGEADTLIKKEGAAIVVILLVTINLFMVTSVVFSGAFKFALPESAGKAEPFTQHYLTPATHGYGPSSAMYPALLRGEGAKNCYETVASGRKATALEDARYRGEYYLLGFGGSVEQSLWSPGRLAFEVDLKEADILVVNQNFHGGWKSDKGVLNHNGLLAVELDEGKGKVELRYMPGSFVIGVLLSVLSIIGALVLALFCRGRGRP